MTSDEYNKKYREQNRERIRQQDRERYRKLTPEQKEQRLKWSRESYERNKDKVLARQRERHLKINYSLSKDEYDSLVKEQNGCCAICGKPEHRKLKTGEIKPLSVDHCHTTGEVRKLLCNDCNALLGFCKEDISILEKSIEYLKYFQRDNRGY